MRVAIVMGSDSDWKIMQVAYELLTSFGVDSQTHVMSAHRTPDTAISFAKNAKSEGYGVIIAGAGMAAHLAGIIAAHTTLPVIGVPLKGGALDGLDALLSTVQMPPGVPVATVGLNAAKNAALLAIQILALGDATLTEKLVSFQSEQADAVAAKDRKLQEELQ